MLKYLSIFAALAAILSACQSKGPTGQASLAEQKCIPIPGDDPCPSPTPEPMPKYTWSFSKSNILVKRGEYAYIDLYFEADKLTTKDFYVNFNIETKAGGLMTINSLKIPTNTLNKKFPVKVMADKNINLDTYKVTTIYDSFTVTALLPRSIQFGEAKVSYEKVVGTGADSLHNIYLATNEVIDGLGLRTSVLKIDSGKNVISITNKPRWYTQSFTVSNDEPVVTSCPTVLPGDCVVTKLKSDGSKVWEYMLSYGNYNVMTTKSNGNVVLAFDENDPTIPDSFASIKLLELDRSTGVKIKENRYYIDEINRKSPNPSVEEMFSEQKALLIDSLDNIYLVGQNIVKTKFIAGDGKLESLYVLKIENTGSTKLWQCGGLIVPNSCPFSLSSGYDPKIVFNLMLNSAAIDKTNGDIYLTTFGYPNRGIILDNSLNLKSTMYKEVRANGSKYLDSVTASVFDSSKKQLYLGGDGYKLPIPSPHEVLVGKVDSDFANSSFQIFGSKVERIDSLIINNDNPVVFGITTGAIAGLHRGYHNDLFVYWPTTGIDF